MRVAVIASSLRLAGAEKQIVYMARAMYEAGIDARVYYLGKGDYYQQVLSQSPIPLSHIYHRCRPLLMLARLCKQLLIFRPQVVLASQFGDLIFAGPAGRLVGSLVVGGVRSDGFYELNTYARRKSFMLWAAHGLIANSTRAKSNLVSRGIDCRKITLLPNVIDLAEFDARARMLLSSVPRGPRPIVAAIGSLHPCKRFDRFLEALAIARGRQPQLFGIIAGKDLGAKAALQEHACTLGLGSNHLCFLGECVHIPALLSRSRLLVLSSEYEGFPNVILEAMAARLPVVTTPAGDASLIVNHGVTGYVVANEDCQSMADCIVRLIENRDLATQMGQAGRLRIEQEYTFDSLAGRLLAIFREFASQQRRASLQETLETPCFNVRPFKA